MCPDNDALWFAGKPPDRAAQIRLFCFPYAGLGASAFRRWNGLFDAEIDVCAVELPGRETRQPEPLMRSMDAIVDAALAALAPYAERPFALFGYSMGALIAFELARRLGANPFLRHLFVAARRAPQCAEPLGRIADLDDARFVDAVQSRYGGIPAPVLACPELLELLLPRLRADFEVLESYVYREHEPLPCGISVFGGIDDPTVARAELSAWQTQTAEPGIRLRMLPGGHLFLQEQRSALADAIASDLGLLRAVHGMRR
jgi:medium-chain acyl-[acyl-carrier-protein] hydrolase